MGQRIPLTKSPTLSKLFLNNHNHTYTCVCARVRVRVRVYVCIYRSFYTFSTMHCCKSIFLREALHFPTGGVVFSYERRCIFLREALRL
jgi:hypothetical protein